MLLPYQLEERICNQGLKVAVVNTPGLPSTVSGGGLRSYLLMETGAGAPYTSQDSIEAA